MCPVQFSHAYIQIHNARHVGVDATHLAPGKCDGTGNLETYLLTLPTPDRGTRPGVGVFVLKHNRGKYLAALLQAVQTELAASKGINFNPEVCDVDEALPGMHSLVTFCEPEQQSRLLQ